MYAIDSFEQSKRVVCCEIINYAAGCNLFQSLIFHIVPCRTLMGEGKVSDDDNEAQPAGTNCNRLAVTKSMFISR